MTDGRHAAQDNCALGPQPLLRWEAPDDAIHAVAFSPDGRTLASASADGNVKLWSAAPRLSASD